MKNGYNNIINSRWPRFFLLLVMAYFSQVYSLSHLHHIHEVGLLEFEINSHPIKGNGEHSKDHHHNGNRPHSDDHQHTYDNHIDWHLIRTQSPKTLTFDEYYFSPFNPYVLSNDNNSFNYVFEESPLTDEYHVSFLTIRGSPLFG